MSGLLHVRNAQFRKAVEMIITAQAKIGATMWGTTANATFSHRKPPKRVTVVQRPPVAVLRSRYSWLFAFSTYVVLLHHTYLTAFKSSYFTTSDYKLRYPLLHWRPPHRTFPTSTLFSCANFLIELGKQLHMFLRCPDPRPINSNQTSWQLCRNSSLI